MPFEQALAFISTAMLQGKKAKARAGKPTRVVFGHLFEVAFAFIAWHAIGKRGLSHIAREACPGAQEIAGVSLASALNQGWRSAASVLAMWLGSSCGRRAGTLKTGLGRRIVWLLVELVQLITDLCRLFVVFARNGLTEGCLQVFFLFASPRIGLIGGRQATNVRACSVHEGDAFLHLVAEVGIAFRAPEEAVVPPVAKKPQFGQGVRVVVAFEGRQLQRMRMLMEGELRQ